MALPERIKSLKADHNSKFDATFQVNLMLLPDTQSRPSPRVASPTGQPGLCVHLASKLLAIGGIRITFFHPAQLQKARPMSAKFALVSVLGGFLRPNAAGMGTVCGSTQTTHSICKLQITISLPTTSSATGPEASTPKQWTAMRLTRVTTPMHWRSPWLNVWWQFASIYPSRQLPLSWSIHPTQAYG